MAVPLLISNARIVTPDAVLDNGWLLADDGKIQQFGTGDTLPETSDDAVHYDAMGKWLLPGFIDIHVHGGDNHEAMDATPQALAHMAQFYARHGVTSFLATTWTDSKERILTALKNIKNSVGRQNKGATLLGAHLEGPFLNPAKCGAQNINHIRRASKDETDELLSLDVIRLAAVAPEYEENHDFIEECVSRNVTVSAAHTGATYEQLLHSIELGITQTTHTFNAMTGIHHRKPGVAGAALTQPDLYCELIADNIHVHPAVMKLISLAKGADRIILISDAVRSAGMPDGDYTIDERTVTVKDGVVRLENGTLAGSTLTMDRAFRNFLDATNTTIPDYWQVTSANAAKSINVTDQRGSIAVGKCADLVLVDEAIHVYLTVCEGGVVHHDPAYSKRN